MHVTVWEEEGWKGELRDRGRGREREREREGERDLRETGTFLLATDEGLYTLDH